MKKILGVLTVLFSASAYADVVSVFVWEAPVGHAQQMFANGLQAEGMHEEMGAAVQVGQSQRFHMYYVMRFESAAARGAFVDKINASAEWQAFMGEVSQREGAATMVRVYNMTVLAQSEEIGGPAAVVFQYKPNPGQAQAVVANALQGKAIHEKMGANVQVLLDEEGMVHYVTTHASWAAQGEFEDAVNGGQNEEWDAFWEGVTSNPTAELVDVLRITAGSAPPEE